MIYDHTVTRFCTCLGREGVGEILSGRIIHRL